MTAAAVDFAFIFVHFVDLGVGMTLQLARAAVLKTHADCKRVHFWEISEGFISQNDE